MSLSKRKRVLFTFGNHMHWVDMQWLWGYHVLPGSVRDMLYLCRETGVKGNVNFDGVGYEKMAGECPDALAELRDAVKAGVIEPVGCSYGQPYGLFHGGESNVRQFTYGVRSALRLLGVRPRAFWEEEFYFFPQLPQILRGCGFESANLFFQWTWHTPEVPKENCALILWEGIDGTRIPALPRNELNLHQWPEDFGPMFESNLLRTLDQPAITQWIELMPSMDWMCRSEVLLPKLRELLAHPEFEIVPGTMSDVVAALLPTPAEREPVPIRAYTMDDVWHGMTLGKNGDRHPRTSRRVEQSILAAESMSAMASLFGRPYASWDVYPTWELDEAWRELLAAQHHDNHECEGLCGFVGYHQMEKADRLATEVLARTCTLIRFRQHPDLTWNTAGFTRCVIAPGVAAGYHHVVTVPPFGYAQIPDDIGSKASYLHDEGNRIILERGPIRSVLNRDSVQIESMTTRSGETEREWIREPIGVLRMQVDGKPWRVPPNQAAGTHGSGVTVDRCAGPGVKTSLKGKVDELMYEGLRTDISLARMVDAIEIEHMWLSNSPRPDPGLRAALRMPIRPSFDIATIRADSPFAVHDVRGTGHVRRKYPTGDWMTSPQWFEELDGAITSHSFIDLIDRHGSGLLICHNGSQQWFRTEQGVDVVLNAFDPWDEMRYSPDFAAGPCFRILPHGPMRDNERIRHAISFEADLRLRYMHCRDECALRPPFPVGGGGPAEPGTMPSIFGGLEVCNADNVIAHAFYRANEKEGEHLPNWAGHRMNRESNGACTHPFVVRFVEWDGEPADVILKFPGAIAMGAKTNLMGEVVEEIDGSNDTCWLVPEPAEPPRWVRESNIPWSQVRFNMRPREIATVMADLVMGRKQYRDLDSRRKVWATVHREKR